MRRSKCRPSGPVCFGFSAIPDLTIGATAFRPSGPETGWIPVHDQKVKPFYARQVEKIVAADKAAEGDDSEGKDSQGGEGRGS